jgi:hypothetical protein
MTGTEMVSETFVIFKEVTRLIVRKDFSDVVKSIWWCRLVLHIPKCSH